MTATDRLSAKLQSYRRRPTREAKSNWGRYAAATGAAVAGASTAEAAVIHVTPVNPLRLTINATSSSTSTGASVDIDGDGVDDLSLFLQRFVSSTYTTSEGVTYNTVSDVGAALGVNPSYLYYGTNAPNGAWVVTDTYSIRNLASGDLISTGDPLNALAGFRAVSNYTITTAGGYSNVGRSTSGQFPADGTGIAGFGFQIGGQGHLGWLRVAIESDPTTGQPVALELVEWAYESVPGESIRAGEVPEPTGLMLLATGAAGVAALRRRAA